MRSEANIPGYVRRAIPFVFPVVLVMGSLLQLFQISRPSFFTIHDDGIYLTAAKALAEGKGYVIDSLPVTLAQTKYPILFPAMLAAVWKVYPEFPANLPWLRLVPLACYWGWLYLVWKLIGELLGMRERAKWIIALLISAPLVGLFARMPMSEMPFAFFSTWVVLLLTRIHLTPGPPSMRRVLMLGFAFALAYHTRTVAVALLPVMALTLARKKAWPGLTVFGLLTIGTCAPWAYWQSVHPPPSEGVLRYYTHANYGDWNLLGGAQVADPAGIVIWNAASIILWPQHTWAIPFQGWQAPAYLVTAVITAMGMWTLSGASGFCLALWTISNLAVLLVWISPPWRLLVPVLPFLLLALTSPVPATAPGAVRALARAAATVLIVVGIWVSNRPVGDEPFWAEHSLLFDWLRKNSSKQAILAGNLDPSYWLYANRKSIRAYEYDLLRLYYGESEGVSVDEDARKLDRLLETYGVEFVIFEDIPKTPETKLFQQRLDALRARSDGRLQRVFATPSERILVFRVRNGLGFH